MQIDTRAPCVTSADFVRHFGEWQDRAVNSPIYVTHHGRARIVAMSASSYAALAERAQDRGATHSDPILLAHLNDGVIIVDRGLRIVAANRMALDCLHLREADVLDRTPGEVATFEQLPIARYLERAIHAGEQDSFDAPSPVVTERWLRFRVFRHGEGAACLMRDISEEIAARRDETRAAAALAALRAHGAIGQARLSPRGTFVHLDDVLAQMVGVSPEALVRVRLTDILALDRRAQALSHLEDVLTGGTPRAFDSQLLSGSGERRPIRISLAALRRRDDGGGAAMIVTPA